MAIGWYCYSNITFKQMGVMTHSIKFDPRIAKMLSMNYAACKALIEITDKETPYKISNFDNGNFYIVDTDHRKGIAISSFHCVFSLSYVQLYESEYITKNSYDSIVDTIWKMFNRLDKLKDDSPRHDSGGHNLPL